MTRTSLRSIAGLLVLTVVGGAFADDRVETAAGIVEGTTGPNGIRSFKGIPFAEPPVGELRWKSPQPVKRWQGIKMAQVFASAPIQNPSLSTMMGVPPRFSEDCLYLNVWTPATVRPTPNIGQLKALDAYYAWRREQAKKQR